MEDKTLSMGDVPDAPAHGELRTWGPFHLVEKAGEGKYGEVYRAWDTKLQRQVALKLFKPRGLDDQASYEEVVREARLLARVKHPNIVPVYGVDRYDGRVGFWSDFICGETLERVVQNQGPLEPRDTALIGVELCRALGAMHAAGLLHRDIKTGNVMREDDGRILLVDFGLSRESMTMPGLVGTPLYMAPELFAGSSTSVASDLYALGVLLYHLATGKYPVDAEDLVGFREAHASMSRVNLSDARGNLPERFIAVVERAMRCDPAARFATAGEMLAALSEFVGEPAKGPVERPSAKLSRTILVAAIALVLLTGTFGAIRYRSFRGQRSSLTNNDSSEYLQATAMLVRFDNPANVDQSIERFTQLTRKDPKFALAFAGLGRAQYQKARTTRNLTLLDPARQASNHALELDNQLAPAYATLGLIETMQGNYDLGLQDLRKALSLDARTADGHASLAEIYVRQGRNKDAEAEFQKAIDLAPEDWRWPNQLGAFYLAAGRLGEASAEFVQVTKRSPDNAFGFLNLGLTYLRQERFADAEIALKKSIQLRPNFAAYNNLSIVYALDGKYANAAEMSQKTIALNPGYYNAWGNLGAAYEWTPGGHAKAQEAYKKAAELAEEAKRKSPKDPQILSNLGAYYAALGQSEKALPLLREAIALAPDNPVFIFRAGEASEILGHRADALRWVGEALRLGFSPELVRRSPELARLRADPRFSAQPPKHIPRKR